MPPKPKPRLEWNDPDIQITPKRERKKVYRPTIDKLETGFKKTIKNLKGKVANEKKEVRLARKSRDKAKETKRIHTKRAIAHRVSYERYRARKYISKMWDKKWEFANEIMMYRVRKATLNSSKYLSGISAFPIISDWCKQSKVNPTTFGIFILLNHYEWFTPADGIFFGHTKKTTTAHLKKLVALGLADIMRSNKIAYVSSVLGKDTFKDFKKYHDERMIELMDNFKKAFSESEDMFDLKKYRKTRKPVENGDKQEDTEQQAGG